MHSCKHCRKDFPSRRAFNDHLGENGRCPLRTKPETPHYVRGKYVSPEELASEKQT